MTTGAIALALLPACVRPQEGQLYRRDVATVASFRIANVEAAASAASAELADGTRCAGQVSRVDSSVGPPYEDGERPGFETDGALAVLVCLPDLVLRCNLTSRLTGGYAFGECADQRGGKYTVLF